MELPRAEYPRPDFARDDWQNLNGFWEFSFQQPVFDKRILVPFCYQSKASGIGDPRDVERVWYRRHFTIESERIGAGRILLHFGAVDYSATCWINGTFVGEHQGGHTSFCLDITEQVHSGENEVVLCAADDLAADKPRGKQSWIGKPFHCWYTATTGIWQSVWIEYAGDVYLRRVKITPDVDRMQATYELFLSSSETCMVEIQQSLETKEEANTFAQLNVKCKNGYGKAIASFPDWDIRRNELLWSPDRPNLIDVNIRVVNPGKDDRVSTYFGLRQISISGSSILLNGDLCFQRLVLDQGYWPDSLLTPPSDEAIRQDIQLVKDMGFNGVRKHQKIEDPRFYYWADKMGLLVWGELPSAYQFNDNAIERSSRELIEFVERDYNHPCIITWVPINESWGVRNILTDQQQQDYARALLYLIKSLDKTRLISGNDGWEQISQTDICAIHDYSLQTDTLDKYHNMEKVLHTGVRNRILYADGNAHCHQPIIMSEYGGIAFEHDTAQGWGYYDGAKDEQEYLERILSVTHFLRDSGLFAGYCYTQLTDVLQEVNGLLTQERKPKVPIEQLKTVFCSREG